MLMLSQQQQKARPALFSFLREVSESLKNSWGPLVEGTGKLIDTSSMYMYCVEGAYMYPRWKRPLVSLHSMIDR